MTVVVLMQLLERVVCNVYFFLYFQCFRCICCRNFSSRNVAPQLWSSLSQFLDQKTPYSSMFTQLTRPTAHQHRHTYMHQTKVSLLPTSNLLPVPSTRQSFNNTTATTLLILLVVTGDYMTATTSLSWQPDSETNMITF